jgi:hypothetical protein
MRRRGPGPIGVFRVFDVVEPTTGGDRIEA